MDDKYLRATRLAENEDSVESGGNLKKLRFQEAKGGDCKRKCGGYTEQKDK